MSDYNPTREQIAALAVSVMDHLLAWNEAPDVWVTDDGTAKFIASPAFRQIIRAAQAEAWDKGQRDGWEDPTSEFDFLTPRERDRRSRQETNPYREDTNK